MAQKSTKYLLGVVVIAIVIVVYKFRFLHLPYYWDEAWPYSAGINIMCKHGLSLFPGSVPPFIARGHPLMFHFLAAGWMDVFDASLVAGHSFALLISVLVLFVIYIFGKEFFSDRVGFIASLLFAAQPVFIAQSTFLMPEMMMALWTMLTFYFYLKRKTLLYLLFATAMLLTKESGAVLICALFLWQLIEYFFEKVNDFRTLLRNECMVIAPAFVASVYFVLQKIYFGWFLFPFYMDHIKSDWKEILTKLPSEVAYLFIYDGRIGISFFILVALVVIFLLKKYTFSKNECRIILIFSCYILLYLMFSAVNYYIPRYLLCVFPCFILIAAVLIDKAFNEFKLIYMPVIIGIAGICVFFFFVENKMGDKDDSNSIKADMSVVRFFENNNLYDAAIFCPSVLRIDLNEPAAGYLSGKVFTNVQSGFAVSTQYCVFSSDEHDAPLKEAIQKGSKLALIRKILVKNAWREIYQVMR